MASNRLYAANVPQSTTGLVPANTYGGAVAALPATNTITTTTETVITAGPNQTNAQVLVLQIPPGGPLEQRPFDVVASGEITTGASSTVNVKLYSGVSATVASNTLLGASGAITAFSGKTSWYAKATLIYDSISGKMSGTIKFLVNNVLVAETAISNIITGISNANNPVASFVLSVTFGTANAGNIIVVQDFAVNF
jgi:hypothetical protein